MEMMQCQRKIFGAYFLFIFEEQANNNTYYQSLHCRILVFALQFLWWWVDLGCSQMLTQLLSHSPSSTGQERKIKSSSS